MKPDIGIWTGTQEGWVTEASTLVCNGNLDPQNNPVRLRDWSVERSDDEDNEVLAWHKTLPTGEKLTVYND